MFLIIVYVIAGILVVTLGVWSMVAIIKIHRLLNEIIESGALPTVLVRRARQDAGRMLMDGVIHDSWKFKETCKILREVDGSKEAIQLVSQLNTLKKT